MGIFDFFTQKKIDFKDLKARGAVVVDVRTSGEFAGGNLNGSKNIPLDQIEKRAAEIKKWGKPVIFCCRSGNRSGMAANYMSAQGVESYNGGSWQEVQWQWID